MENIIEVKNLSYKINGTTILNDISFNIRRGEFTSIVGPNGAGKTTLIKCLSDNLDFEGEIKLLNKNIKNYTRKEIARIISVVPQEYTLPFNFKVIDIIKMGRNPYKNLKNNIDSEKNKNLIYKAMIQTNTYNLKDRYYNNLSGGEKQRVITARALAQDTEVMFLDEVTSSLDLHHQLEIVELLYKINKEKNITLVSIMHDLNMASRFSDRILFINEGKLLEYDTPDKVFKIENLSKAYNMEMIIKDNKLLNYKEIIPLRINRNINKKNIKIHLICGGGTGEYIIERLYSQRYDISCGIIHDGDSDLRVCKSLDIDCIVEKPFSEFSEKKIEKNKVKIQEADIVIVTDVPFGKHNIMNLQLLKEYKKKKIIILHNDERDFVDGKSDEIIEEIKKRKNTYYAKNLKELFGYIDMKN